MKCVLRWLWVGLVAMPLVEAQEPVNEASKKWVSTGGASIPVTSEAKPPGDFLLLRITSTEERDRALDQLRKHLGTPAGTEHVLFHAWSRGLMVRNYDEEVCYILISPATRDRDIKQPYYLEGKTELVFEFRQIEKKEADHLSVRLYFVKREEDRFTKAVLVDGTVRALKPQGP